MMDLIIYEDQEEIYMLENFPAKPCKGELLFIDDLEFEVISVWFDITKNRRYFVSVEVRQRIYD